MAKRKQRPGWKRVLITADRHCGHRVGLTPPGWQVKNPDGEVSLLNRQAKWAEIEHSMWEWYSRTVTSLRPFHLVIDLGDMVDGPGKRSGGTELISTDHNAQIDMAIKGMTLTQSRNYCLVRGTPYHAGQDGNWENQIASHLDSLTGTDQVTIGDHEWPEVNGVIFDCKHKIGGSQIPYRNNGNLKKAFVWNALWSEYDEQPRAQIFLRGHVHWYEHTEFNVAGRTVHLATCPPLQGMGSTYGAQQCEGHVDFGLIAIDIGPEGEIEWHSHIASLKAQQAHTTKF